MDLRARVGVAHPKLLTVIQKMEETVEEPLSCADLARAAGFSQRQLERLFVKYLGEPPTRYYMKVRLQRARQPAAPDEPARARDRALLRLRLGLVLLQDLSRAFRPLPLGGAQARRTRKAWRWRPPPERRAAAPRGRSAAGAAASDGELAEAALVGGALAQETLALDGLVEAALAGVS